MGNGEQRFDDLMNNIQKGTYSLVLVIQLNYLLHSAGEDMTVQTVIL